jgi:hypothetical protein
VEAVVAEVVVARWTLEPQLVHTVLVSTECAQLRPALVVEQVESPRCP